LSEKDANVGSISFIGIFAYSYSSVNRFEAFAFVLEILSEVQEMCRLGVIERSKSPYSSPMPLVKKKTVQTALLLISKN